MYYIIEVASRYIDKLSPVANKANANKVLPVA